MSKGRNGRQQLSMFHAAQVDQRLAQRGNL